MNIDAGLSIVVSFVGFSWFFAKKIYPFITKTLDEHIESVKKKIYEAEILKDEASLALKEAYVKKNDIESIIEENRKLSREKIQHLHEENEQYLKMLHERHEVSLKNRLDAELAKQRTQLIERLSDLLLERLHEKINRSDCKVSTSITKEDLQKLL